jgi:hypothetical protein
MTTHAKRLPAQPGGVVIHGNFTNRFQFSHHFRGENDVFYTRQEDEDKQANKQPPFSISPFLSFSRTGCSGLSQSTRCVRL